MSGSPWNIQLLAQSSLSREHELAPVSQKLGHAWVSVRSCRSHHQCLFWPLMQPSVCNDCLPFKEKQICVGKLQIMLANNEIEKEMQKQEVFCGQGSPRSRGSSVRRPRCASGLRLGEVNCKDCRRLASAVTGPGESA